MKLSLFSLFYLLSCYTFCQTISGEWVGNFSKNSLTSNPLKLVVDFDLKNDSVFIGSSHLFYQKGLFEHYNLNGRLNFKDSIITFTETSVISLKIGSFSSNCLGVYNMKLVRNDSIMRLEGIWKDRNNGLFSCGKSNLYLEKLKHPVIKLQNTDTIYLQKTSSIQRVLELEKTESDSILVEIYDYGIADNDIINLYLNNKNILRDKVLTNSPITIWINLDSKYLVNKLKLIAVSEGEIPPCTAFIKIKTKLKTYKVNLESSISSNGLIEFLIKN